MNSSTSPENYTSAAALRSANADAVQVDAQQLQAVVGRIVVASSAQIQGAGPAIKSLYEADSRTLTLLSDRIHVGQEANAFVAALVQHLGPQAAVGLVGQEAVSRHEHEQRPVFAPVNVTAEWIPESVGIEAYSTGKLWNGWAEPHFTMDGVRSLLKLMPELQYDEKRDAVVMPASDAQAEEEVFVGANIIVEGQPVKTYPIGAGFWCWELCDSPAPAESKESAQKPRRTFTPAEERGLSDAQKEYLVAHPAMVSLQPGSMLLPREQLYQSASWGAVTIDHAMELDAVRTQSLANERLQPAARPVPDSYSAAEDRFIDQHGMSSGLF